MKVEGPIKGYKAFRHDMSNSYGIKFQEGRIYHIDGDISFGINGNGFHLCKNIEDTFRYIDDDNPVVAAVTAFGEIVEGYDTYNDYYDMYSASDIKIEHILNREEVIAEILKKSEISACRFIVTGFKLDNNEVERFKEHYSNSATVRNYIDYYVNGDEEAFYRGYSGYLKKR